MRSGEAFFITLVEMKPPVRNDCGLSPALARNGLIKPKWRGGVTCKPRRQKSFHEFPNASTQVANLPATKLVRASAICKLSGHHSPAFHVSRIQLTDALNSSVSSSFRQLP